MRQRDKEYLLGLVAEIGIAVEREQFAHARKAAVQFVKGLDLATILNMRIVRVWRPEVQEENKNE